MNLRQQVKPFKALGNERRMQILQLLLKGQPLNVSDIAFKLRVTFRSISKHLQVLENASLVVRQRTGASVYYRPRFENKEMRLLFSNVKNLK